MSNDAKPDSGIILLFIFFGVVYFLYSQVHKVMEFLPYWSWSWTPEWIQRIFYFSFSQYRLIGWYTGFSVLVSIGLFVLILISPMNFVDRLYKRVDESNYFINLFFLLIVSFSYLLLFLFIESHFVRPILSGYGPFFLGWGWLPFIGHYF